MAKSKREPEAADGEKPKKKHLHQIVTEAAHDGSLTHHHIYKDRKEDTFSHPSRLMATSSTPEEAGDHVSEQFAANQAQPAPDEQAAAAPAEGAPEDQDAGAAPQQA